MPKQAGAYLSGGRIGESLDKLFGSVVAVIVCFFFARWLVRLSNDLPLGQFLLTVAGLLAVMFLIAWIVDKRRAARERERFDR